MRIRLLGTAAGGGLPQWNCGCGNCHAARCGFISRRTQSSVAVSGDGVRWFLVNASPDLREQVESFPALRARPGPVRNSAIAGVLLSNADLDHVLGLMLLREGARLELHATPAVRETLCGSLDLETILGAFCGLSWRPPPSQFEPLHLGDNTPSGLFYRAIPLAGERAGNSVAFQLRTAADGPRLLVAPQVAAFSPELEQALGESEAVLIDGTFWQDDELCAWIGSPRTSRQMGHLPISGAAGTLAVLDPLAARRKIYLHINNTNPILRPGSRERAEVEAAGVEVGEDGMEFEL